MVANKNIRSKTDWGKMRFLWHAAGARLGILG
jgi:hypothetical protein